MPAHLMPDMVEQRPVGRIQLSDETSLELVDAEPECTVPSQAQVGVGAVVRAHMAHRLTVGREHPFSELCDPSVPALRVLPGNIP